MKNCSKCNLTFEDDKKFCNSCGSALTLITNSESNVELSKTGKRCLKCNLSYDEDKKFCKNCGSPLSVIKQTLSKVDAKIMVFEEKLKENQLNIDLLTEYAQFLYDHSDYKETTFILFRILAINENNKLAKNLLFSCYQELKQYQNAVEIGEELLIKNAKDITLLERLAILEGKLKQQEKVYIYSNKIIEIDSDNILALTNIFHYLLAINKISEALPISTKLILLGQNERLILIYGGIDKILQGNFKLGIQNFDGILTIPNDERNNIHSNRCRLYWAYCLCMSNSELIELERKFNDIDLNILKKIPFEFDEEIAVKIISYIINRSLEEIENSQSAGLEIDDLIESIKNKSLVSFLTEKSNPVIAEIYYKIALKQKEFRLNEDALSSINKAFYLTPKELKYSDFKIEIQGIVDTNNAKHKRNNRFKIISIACVILIIGFSVKYNLKRIENNKWSSVKTNNTIRYSLISLKEYLNEYPNGKYANEAKQKIDSLLRINALNSINYESYKLYNDSSFYKLDSQKTDSLNN